MAVSNEAFQISRDALVAKVRGLRIALLMCAAHCQGGHSEAGAHAAEALGTTFPITMEKLARVARKDGLDPDKLWPWWKQLKQSEGRL